MCQVFPHHGHLMEDLLVSLTPENGELQHRGRTSLTFCELPLGSILTRLIRTFEPSKIPSYTHPRRESESVHDFGSTSLTLHIFLSSCSDS